MPLTETQAKNAKPRERAYKLADSEGLFLLVQPNGTKLWRMKYRVAGKEKLLSFGAYPALGIAAARDKRKAAKALLAEGKDPMKAKGEVISENGDTFYMVAKRWHENRQSALNPAHAERVWSRMERDVFPSLGQKLIHEITAPEVLDMIRRIETRGALDISRRAKQGVGQVFQFAIACGLASSDPTAHLSGALKPRPRVKHMSRLPLVEIPAFLEKLRAYQEEGDRRSVITRDAVLFALLTWVRTKELRLAVKSEFENLDGTEPVWRIPAARMKMGREHLVPLSAQAALIARKMVSAATGDYLFPGTHPDKPLSENTMTAFANREAFVADIRDGGIAAMELVARDLKSLGLYTARALSFAGVEYEILEHCLTEDQIAVYDAYAEAWAIIHANLREALEATRIVDSETGGTLNSGAKSAALSIFEGTKQRFFAQLLLSIKLPSLLPAIDTAIADGHAVVVQLVSTAEAMLDRRLADLPDGEREALEIDLSPREYVIDYLAKSFPVRLMAVFTDENGNPRSEPMSDEHGAPVLCRSALAARDRMIEQLCALPPIATALDAVIERFGVDQVAEVTGRTRRLIVGRDGRQKLQSRSPRANVAETQAFMGGSKRILVFSDAGGTGRSYHADLAARNQARRVHFLLEPGWRADAAIQGLGRTNRTNQASAPLFRPVTTDVRGERRFISTIARRAPLHLDDRAASGQPWCSDARAAPDRWPEPVRSR